MGNGPAAVLIQLGDLHVGADRSDVDPLQRLSATVDAVRRLDLPVAAVLVLGDLVDHGTDAEYLDAKAQLERLQAPIHVAMGNHDHRETLRRQFGFRPAGGAPLNYATELGPVRLIVLDTTIPGEDAGHLELESLKWLHSELCAFPQTPTLLAMHHPPLLTGSEAWDQLALAADARAGLADTLDRHPQVRQILGAHLHRPLVAQFAARPLLVAPSTYVQFPVSVGPVSLDPTGEPPGFVAHMISGDASVISVFKTVTQDDATSDRP